MKIQWITLNVKDMVRSKAFYEEFLGLPCVRSFSPGHGMQIAFFQADNGMQIELMEAPELPYRHIQGVSIGIETTNYAELLEKAKQAGILHGEPQLLGGKLECFFILDPDGMGIQLIKS